MSIKYKQKPHVNKAKRYAKSVVRGKTLVCKWTRLACKRFLDDLTNEKKAVFPYRFNADRAERFCVFAELMPHVKGKWSGTTLILENWQCFLLVNLFGWEDKKTGLRRFQRAFVFLPRKNGKTTIAAIIGLGMLTIEAEPGAEVYCGATSEDQANEVFRPAKAMANKAKGFKEQFGVEVMASSIHREDELSFFRRLIGKPGEGQSPYCAIHDEYHEHPTSEQVDSMNTGMGSRQEPLQLIITTAGVDISSPCKEFDDYARQVIQGIRKDDQLFVLIYAMNEGDDWKDLKTWKKANPNYGVSVSKQYLKNKLNEAKQRVSQQNIIRCKHLNEWMNVSTRWIDADLWRKGEDKKLNIDNYKGEPCFIGLDLASKIDICSLIRLFQWEGLWIAFANHYLPSETIWLPQNQHYQQWLTEGWIIETEGARTDFRQIETDIKKINGINPIVELAFDPREAGYLIADIQEWASFECVEIVQGPAHMSEPMKELEAVIHDNKIRHNGDPVLAWMISNVIKKQGKMGGAVKYYYPTKEKDDQKIDGVIALIMALNRAISHEDETSVYETRGLRSL